MCISLHSLLPSIKLENLPSVIAFGAFSPDFVRLKLYFVALFVLFPAEEKNFKVWGQFFPVIAITKNEPREQFCQPRPKAEAGNGSRGSFFCDQDNWKKLSETWKFIYEAAWNRKNQCNRVLFCIFPIKQEKNFPRLGLVNFPPRKIQFCSK